MPAIHCPKQTHADRWQKMTPDAAVRRCIAEALFAHGATLNETVETLNLNRHTAEGWRYVYLCGLNGSVCRLFDRASQREFIVPLLKDGFGYKVISRTFGLDLWFVRDTARSFRRGLLDYEGGLHK